FGRSGTCGTSDSSDSVRDEKPRETKEKRRELKRDRNGGSAGSSQPSAPSIISDSRFFADIASVIQTAGAVALDVETFGQRKSDALDPWRGEVRLLSLKVAGSDPWLIDLQSTGYDLHELSTALESVLIVAHNAKFDALW